LRIALRWQVALIASAECCMVSHQGVLLLAHLP
jgi:hypothetical protein